MGRQTLHESVPCPLESEVTENVSSSAETFHLVPSPSQLAVHQSMLGYSWGLRGATFTFPGPSNTNLPNGFILWLDTTPAAHCLNAGAVGISFKVLPGSCLQQIGWEASLAHGVSLPRNIVAAKCLTWKIRIEHDWRVKWLDRFRGCSHWKAYLINQWNN